MSKERVYLYDSTLRDGAQTNGVDFGVADKRAIAEELDRLGIDYIEGGWPGANPTDTAFFENPPPLTRARLAAFGMTRRFGRSAENDPGFQAILGCSPVVTMFGKTWDFHVMVALGVSLSENLEMIASSVAEAVQKNEEAIFDCEHFFDGYRANPAYALDCARAAYQAGARWVVLCDTNGGFLPHEVTAAVEEVLKTVPGDHLGIHCHNDSDNGVANTLAAVRAGVRHVQGTLNGLGERCGNANLISIIPNLMLKMGFDTGASLDDLKNLTRLSRMVDERINRAPLKNAPYVGESAFAHKGGVHASAVEKDPRSYEHIAPEQIGNLRHIVVSDQSGKANLLARLRDVGLDVDPDDPRLDSLIKEVKEREYLGYSYDFAEASFELLARAHLDAAPEFFRILSFRVLDERRREAGGEIFTMSEATVKLEVMGRLEMGVAEGNGPVSALDAALRKVLTPTYPRLNDLHLVDYRVRILDPEAATEAVTRVLIESADSRGGRWATVGVSANVIEASSKALIDSITYCLMQKNADGAARESA
ncbi:citramalate synthase [Alphaproteobacteria bacterium]|nr:citramalate synthase [Alphaproteobacteria bacterium]